MTKGRYPYPDDEFDAVDGSVGPRGVHRAPISRWSRLWPFLLVIVLFPALAFGVVTYVFNWDGLGADSGAGSSQDASQGVDGSVDDESGDAAVDEGTDAGATEGTDEGAADAPAADAPAADVPAAAVDKALPVDVLNAAKVSGLAAKAGAKLTAAGFTNVTPDNYTGAKTTTSGVYYATEDQQPTAAAAAAALGITTVELSTTKAADGITVVLASDFTL
ncbi:LytR C-terminal domain-containing protein [Cellulomonas sp. P22]|uniref:LytR C-terminal domain-containing protein n=1 Tax=Cellulomonas sp. P22 TaxID=3373189 RepID=UPI0037B43F40